ncbi:hypothetical protein MRB53_016320 [Persea americana]|uniref:Uncharacterized protein n=1 Tax=Persea americana TaxID=3435 RepID=A0ACC2M1H8_PERAE|nr:hypothetical protein MRB53_016320 [Persea americana]
MAQQQRRWKPADPPSPATGTENCRGLPNLQAETGWSLSPTFCDKKKSGSSCCREAASYLSSVRSATDDGIPTASFLSSVRSPLLLL